MTQDVQAVLQLEHVVPLKYLPVTHDKHCEELDPEQVKQLVLHPVQVPADKNSPELHEEH